MIRLLSLKSRVVSFEHYSPRVVAGSTIVFVHAVVLYALAVGPRIESVAAGPPLMVRFISSAESRPQWQPPRVTAITPAVFSQAPQAPLIEIPAPMPSNRAISVMAAPGVPTMNRHEGRSAPKWVSAVEYVREPAPRYPPQSRRLREQGLVVLRVLIDEQGNARSIDIESSSGHQRLDHAAREAIERAAFRPYLEDGTPRRALVLIPVEFALNRGAA